MKALLITTGHNSSAILVEDNQVKWGYETERITGVKSDSAFCAPVLDMHPDCKPDMVYVTHWEPTGQLDRIKSKYFDWSRFDGIPVRTLNGDLDHHDTHAYAALRFAGRDFPADAHVVVVDGFGNYGEHLSIYRADPATQKIELVRRLFGYKSSLGLFYQYMTAFMGLKMHQDEYKLLGYEAYCADDHKMKLEKLIEDTISEYIVNGAQSVYMQPDDPVISVEALPITKEYVFKLGSKVMGELGLLNSNDFGSRAALAYFTQSVMEGVVMAHIIANGVKNVILSGGCFYNVKLNCRIIEHVKGKVCIYPLAGDQGNALGLYAHDHGEFVFPRSLCWGHRDLRINGFVEGLVNDGGWDYVEQNIGSQGAVNVVRGAMEFGPRALCNTSTLALPTLDNVKRINTANDRSTVMPMAPVVTREFYEANFQHTDKLWKSEKYMITALPYKAGVVDAYIRGAAHDYEDGFSGRPQVIDQADDPDLYDLVKKFGGILLNTSFNYHGMPIVFDGPSLFESHTLQYHNGGFETVVMP